MVRERVRDAVLRGDISAGQPLRDSVLAAQMGVSRAPVREALRLLEYSGLVEKSANKPYEVKTFEREDLLELAVLRIALETTAARIVVAQRRDLSSVKSALEQMHAVWASHSEATLNQVDLKLHRAIVEAAGVVRLVERYDDLVDQMVLAWLRHSASIARPADNLAIHDDIVATLERCTVERDPAPIQQLLIDHIRTGMGCSDLVI